MTLLARAGLVVSAVGVSGCTEIQSALAPGGAEAARIAELTWTLFVGALIVFLVVIAALLLALTCGSRWRRYLAAENAVKIGGIAFPAAVLSALFAYGLWQGRMVPSAGAPLQIEVTGEQWWWRVVYRRADGSSVAEANEIRVPVGRPVEIALASADVVHSFWVPALAGKLDMVPGRTNRLRLFADRPGVYRGQCAEFCGGAHALMAFDVVAMPQDEFDSWLMAEPTPSSDAGEPGAKLFLAAGCGGCHAVRGTPASGAIGPDLTRIGARRSIGAATLPAGKDSIARFIKDSQGVKPGNGMPSFSFLSSRDISLIAEFLASRT